MKFCENCESPHPGSYGSGRFCSVKCSRGFSTKNKRTEINKKISSSLTGKGNGNVKLYCENCNEGFEVDWRKRDQKTCSLSCSRKLVWKNEVYRSNFSKTSSEVATKRHRRGDPSFGWKSRKKLKPSYPESIAIRFLDSLGIEYEYEMPLSKYHVDFAIHDKKIAIEIDGQQHSKEDRKITDDRKDSILKEKGWTVFRIKWPDDNIIESLNKILC